MTKIIGLEVVGLFVNTSFEVPDEILNVSDFLRYVNGLDNSSKGFKILFNREKFSNKNYGFGVDSIFVEWLIDTTTKSNKYRSKGVYQLIDEEINKDSKAAPITVWQYYVSNSDGFLTSGDGKFIPAFSSSSPRLNDGDKLTWRCVVIATAPGKWALKFAFSE
jgi:hypothetical protein